MASATPVGKLGTTGKLGTGKLETGKLVVSTGEGKPGRARLSYPTTRERRASAAFPVATALSIAVTKVATSAPVTRRFATLRDSLDVVRTSTKVAKSNARRIG